MLLTRFVASRPRFEITQERSLEWLADAHTDAEKLEGYERGRFAVKIARAVRRVACGPDRIRSRGHSVDLERPRFDGEHVRTRYAEDVERYFASTYAEEPVAPDDLVHVTCTGYASPSAAQKLVARRGWLTTRVTHAYHMGCYAALPALRIARGFVATGSQRVDIAHTELCSLHLDPSDHSLEQLVVQSLFADGMIRYCGVRDQGTRGLAVLALHERVLPDSADSMTWTISDARMKMSLSRDVPDRVASALRGFVLELLDGKLEKLKNAIVAVHPGGPKIIDSVRNVLELDEAQVAASRAVLADYGNMSSATLPHIWMRLLEDPRVPAGTLIPTFAFGPGLTITGALLEKR